MHTITFIQEVFCRKLHYTCAIGIPCREGGGGVHFMK